MNIKTTLTLILLCNFSLFLKAQVENMVSASMQQNQNLQIISNATSLLEYHVFLTSSDNYVSVFAPDDDALLNYVDPVSYQLVSNDGPSYQLWEFKFQPSNPSSYQIEAFVYECLINSDGSWRKGNPVAEITNVQIINGKETKLTNRMKEILGDMIVPEKINSEKSFYKTLNGHFVKIDGAVNTESMKVSGGWQLQMNRPSNIQEITEAKNGTLYVVDTPIMQSSKSVCQTLASMPECSLFLNMLKSCDITATELQNWRAYAGDQLFGNLYEYQSHYYLTHNYDYTIYAPTNEAMMKAFQMGLPTLEDLAAAEEYDLEMEEKTEHSDSAEHVKSIMRDFIKYHIQYDAVFVDNGFDESNYDTKQLQMIPIVGSDGNPTEEYTIGKPYSLRVNASKSGISLIDNMGRASNVITQNGLHNNIACEYWFSGISPNPYFQTIESMANVAVHAIDSPLIYNYHAGSIDPEYNQFIYKERKF
ncbi:MAG: hypothetical protein KBT06_00865 [Prevotellaceae bacterium]|nr:hypothetical protein [Candidatus Colivivens equi]